MKTITFTLDLLKNQSVEKGREYVAYLDYTQTIEALDSLEHSDEGHGAKQ